MSPELEAMARAHHESRRLPQWAMWGNMDPLSRKREIAAMRAALMAIREPSAAMKAVWDPEGMFRGDPDEEWRAAIDHILGAPE